MSVCLSLCADTVRVLHILGVLALHHVADPSPSARDIQWELLSFLWDEMLCFFHSKQGSILCSCVQTMMEHEEESTDPPSAPSEEQVKWRRVKASFSQVFGPQEQPCLDFRCILQW